MTKKHPERPRGRQVKYSMPQCIPDTPENILKVALAGPFKKTWKDLRDSGRKAPNSQPLSAVPV